MPNPVFFIDDVVFELQNLTAGLNKNSSGIGIHAPEAGMLRTELQKLLRSTSSLENWKFLHAVQQINYDKNKTPEELQPKLKELYKKFISSNADEQLNLSSDVFNEIHAKHKAKTLTLVDFLPAVKMIFNDSILSNLSGADQLHFWEGENSINAANNLANELLVIQRITATPSQPKIRLFGRLSDPEGTDVIAIHKAATKAQEDLFALLNKQDINFIDFKIQAAGIMTEFTQQADESLTRVMAMKSKDSERETKLTESLFKIQELKLAGGFTIEHTNQHKHSFR